jgi:hypothetical protein
MKNVTTKRFGLLLILLCCMLPLQGMFSKVGRLQPTKRLYSQKKKKDSVLVVRIHSDKLKEKYFKFIGKEFPDDSPESIPLEVSMEEYSEFEESPEYEAYISETSVKKSPRKGLSWFNSLFKSNKMLKEKKEKESKLLVQPRLMPESEIDRLMNGQDLEVQIYGKIYNARELIEEAYKTPDDEIKSFLYNYGYRKFYNLADPRGAFMEYLVEKAKKQQAEKE